MKICSCRKNFVSLHHRYKPSFPVIEEASDSTRWERLLEIKYENYENLVRMKPMLDYVMPGKVIDAGKGVAEGNVVRYKFSGERLIPHPYDVTITSRVTNVWAFVVTALVILLAIGCLFYRRIRKLIF